MNKPGDRQPGAQPGGFRFAAPGCVNLESSSGQSGDPETSNLQHHFPAQDGRPLRILVFSHSANLSGAELSLLETVTVLRSMGAEVSVILPGRGPLEKRLGQLGVISTVVPYRFWISRVGHPLWKRLARRLVNAVTFPLAVASVQAARPDIVVSNSVAVDLGALAACVARRPHIWLLHEFVGGAGSELTFDLGDAVSLGVMRRCGGRLIANSRTVAHHYRRLLRMSNVAFLYQPVISMEGPAAQREDAVAGVICLLLGSIEQNKGQEDAIKAIACLRSEGLDVRLQIVGPTRGRYIDYLEQLARRLGVDPYITIVARFARAASFYQAADIVLVCSRREAFGRVTVEAMKAGRPVIGARTGGTAELIRPGETGLLYTVGDADDLATHIRALASDPQERARLARNAAEWANVVFTREAYAKGLGQAITETLKRKTVRGRPRVVGQPPSAPE